MTARFTGPASWRSAVDFAVAHEVAWSRDNSDPWGVHGADPPPCTPQGLSLIHI